MYNGLGCLQAWATNAHSNIVADASKDSGIVYASAINNNNPIVSYSKRNNDVISTSSRRNDKDVETNSILLSGIVITTASLVCSVGKDSTYEWFLSEEGIIIFVDGKKFKVLRNGISE